MGISERRAREKERRREEIINAAEGLFFEKGVDSTTMDDIADKAELAKGTLYLYFSSKEDIRYEVAKHAIHILNEMTENLPSAKMNALEKLVFLGRTFVDFAQTEPFRFRFLIFMEGIDLQNISLSKEQIKESIYIDSPIRLVLEYVREGIKEKLIRDDIPAEIIANTLWSQMFGLVQFAVVKSGVYELGGFTAEQLYENHIKIVLNGISR